MAPKNKHRILVLIAQFHPVVGGGETHALDLCKGLIKLKYDVQVLTRRSRSESPLKDMVQGVPVTRLAVRGSPRSGKYMMLFPAVWELIRRRNEYDVIYVCALRVLGIAGVLAAVLLGKKCVLRSEACGEMSGGFIWNSFAEGKPRRSSLLLRKAIALRNRFFVKADAFLSISKLIHDEYVDSGVPAQKIVTIANGIDTDKYTPASGEEDTEKLKYELALPMSRTIVTYSGKLNRGKGLELLLRVWKKISAEKEHLHLMLVGGGDEHSLSCESELMCYIEENELSDTVSFTGYIDNVQDFLKCSDVYVFPSEKESFGLAPLEAMACGVPVIVTKVGDLPNIIKDRANGLMVNPCDENGVYNALKWILENPDKAGKMAEHGRKTVYNKFAMKQVVEKHIAMFDAVMKNKSGSKR